MAQLDPQTALMLARSLQAATGQLPSPELLGAYFQSASPDPLDDALSTARAYLGAQGQPFAAPAAPAAPASLATSDFGGAPGGTPGGGTVGPGPAEGFGTPANVGEAVGQANFGAVGAPFSGLGSAGPAAGKAGIGGIGSLMGMGTVSNPMVSLMMALANEGSKFGAKGETVPGLGIEGLTIGDISQFGLLGDPIASQFLDPMMATSLSPASIASASGRGPSSTISGYSTLGLATPGATGPSARSGFDVADAPSGAPGVGPPGVAPTDFSFDPTAFGEAGPAGAPGAPGAPGDASGTGPGGQAPHAGGYIAGPDNGRTGRDIPATLQEGEFVIPRGPMAEALRRTTRKELKGATLHRKNILPRPAESLDDLLTRARAHFDVGGTAGPGVPAARRPR